MVFLAFAFVGNAQIFGKKELKKHESFPVYLWFNPVIDVDSSTLSDDGANAATLFLVEGYLSDGSPILVMIPGKTLKFLLRLPTKQEAQGKNEFEGFLFTGESLGKKSIEKEKFISRSDVYFEKQKDLFKRNKNTEKWVLWSETPLKVKGQLVAGKFLPTKSSNVNQQPSTQQSGTQQPATQPAKRNFFN